VVEVGVELEWVVFDDQSAGVVAAAQAVSDERGDGKFFVGARRRRGLGGSDQLANLDVDGSLVALVDEAGRDVQLALGLAGHFRALRRL